MGVKFGKEDSSSPCLNHQGEKYEIFIGMEFGRWSYGGDHRQYGASFRPGRSGRCGGGCGRRRVLLGTAWTKLRRSSYGRKHRKPQRIEESQPLVVGDIVSMVRAGVSDDLVISRLSNRSSWRPVQNIFGWEVDGSGMVIVGSGAMAIGTGRTIHMGGMMAIDAAGKFVLNVWKRHLYLLVGC